MEEEKKAIPQVHWMSPLKAKECSKGENIEVEALFKFTSNIQSITVSLTSPESNLNLELHTVQVNNRATTIQFVFVIDSNISEKQLQLNAKIISDAGTNNFKRTLNISQNSIANSIELVKILKNEYGKFIIQKLTTNLSPAGSPRTFDYEFQSCVSINQNLYISTKQTGGLIRVNPNLEPAILLQNRFRADPFIRSMAVYESGTYVTISSPSNQLIGYNNLDREIVRTDLQMDISEEILPIGNIIYSIERPTNGGSFIIANYNQRTGGYISSQNVTRLTAEAHLFDFGNKKQVYFLHNVAGNVQIERFSQNENNISIIDKMEGVCLNQKPLKVSDSEVVIAMRNQLYLFTKDHIKNEIFTSNEVISAVRLNTAKNRLALLTNASITILNYPSFREVSKTNNITNVVDIQFID
tara:strand:+ start:24713 stop:25948 length:1236 start_codon:yes stop_codon:yes gene_type:complete